MKAKKNKILAILLTFALLVNVSAVCAFAQSEDVSPNVVYGDVNGNNRVNWFDVLYLFFARIGFVRLTDAQKLAADVNGDQKVDRTDEKLISQFASRAISCFPVEEIVWPTGTVVETEYDENGVPVLNLFRRFRDQTAEDLQATFAGTGIVAAGNGNSVFDFELGVNGLDFYADVVLRQLGSVKLRSKAAHLKLIEKDVVNINLVLPSLNSYVNLTEELSAEDPGVVDQFMSVFGQYEELIREGINAALSNAFVENYQGTSVTEVGNVRYICETYNDFQCFFAADGTLKRIQFTEQPYAQPLILVVRTEQASVDTNQFRIPALYNKISLHRIVDILSNLLK